MEGRKRSAGGKTFRKLDPRLATRADRGEMDRPVFIDRRGRGRGLCRGECCCRSGQRPGRCPADRPRERLIPSLTGGDNPGSIGGEHLLGVGNQSRDPRPIRLLRWREELEHRRVVAAVSIGGVVEDRVDPEEILLRDRVVFVAVALGAGDRRPHPGAEGRVHPIDDGDVAELLVDRPTLGVGHRVAVEGRCHALVRAGAGKEVAGQLERREAVEGHVGIKGPDDPVAESPDRARGIVGVAGAVGVTGEVEPLPGLMLAVAVVGQQPVDVAFVGIRRRIGDEGIDLLRRRRQADQIEGEAAGKHCPIGLGLKREPVSLEPRQHEGIDRVSHRGSAGCFGHLRADRRHVRPMPLDLRSASHPGSESLHLRWRKPFAAVGRGHDGVGIGRSDAGDEDARVRVPRHDRRVPAKISRRPGVRVETEPTFTPSLPGGLVRPVAAEAAIGEERLDIGGKRRTRRVG